MARQEETPSEALSCRLSPSEALRLDGAMYSVELLDGHARRDQSRVTGGRHTQPAFRGAEPVTDVAVVLPGWARAGPPAWPDLVRRGVASTSHVVQREDTRGGDNAFSCYG